ncbi:winged helix DNA-binding domain-containing protein [Nonomuraea sp. MCN248]|uniref:Winged helix DNA-binding domain-containing protein n=1 Tax=Nonomuraea corallina TaxID=2989783 RepID=A0ABT4SGY6_9ACTN|nr:winged helix DNA-binding domain-containing protein [Nonomuraea corallina]MDA0636240.1 winged helix DNA-binding domain-containing protein [Nonomuraea corallina]
MTWSQVSARRLARAGLAGPVEDGGPAEVVARMCGAHAQVMSAAEMSVALRLDGATRADVREALWGERSLVKTHGPRGTLHLLPARDLPRWVAAMSSIPAGTSPFPEGVRMTAERTEQVVAAIREVLDGRTLTIDELSEAVVEATGPWAGDLVMPAFQTMWPRWRQAMALAAHRGAFVYGPVRGRKVTYTAPPVDLGPVTRQDGRATDERGTETRAADGQATDGQGADGRAALVRAYLRAYGPAAPEHFAQWAGAPRGWAVAAFGLVELEEVRLEGRPAWVLAGDTGTPDEPPHGVRLLPYFDAYLVAGRPRELLYAGEAARRALAGGQAGNYPVLLVDGQVAGVWHQRRSGRRIEVTVESLAELTADRLSALEGQVERIGGILEGTPRLTVGPVRVGAHA